MKILMVTPYFYPKIGGLENYALNIALNLQQTGHSVVIVTSGTTKHTTEETVHNLRVIRIPRLFKLSNTPINPLWQSELKRIFEIEQPDIINAHTPVPYIADMAARAAGKRCLVLTYHNDLVKPSFIGAFLAKTYYTLLGYHTLKRSNLILSTSNYYIDHSKYLQKYRDKIEIVAPGIDSATFNQKTDKSWLAKKYPNKKLVLFIGSLKKTHTHKGVDVLIEAIAEAQKSIHDIHLIIGGKGDAMSTYKTLAESLKIADSVSFPGYIPATELPLYFAGADVFVLASTNEAEGFGMVLQEAMACGTKVIGTSVGGVPDAIGENPLGILVAPANSNQLASAIVTQLTKDDPENSNPDFMRYTSYDWRDQGRLTSRLFEKAVAIQSA